MKFMEQVLNEIEKSIQTLNNKELLTKDIIEFYTLDEEAKRYMAIVLIQNKR